MSALTTLLRKQAEQNPSASYFNVDILKYQIKCKEGAGSCPFQLVAYWKCETTHTDLKVLIVDTLLQQSFAKQTIYGCFRLIINITVVLWLLQVHC